jgi:transposase
MLRLPSYHPDLHPTEHIWADIKQWAAGKNVTSDILRNKWRKIGGICVAMSKLRTPTMNKRI